MKVLSDLAPELAYAIVNQEDEPSWWGMIKDGRTTIPEFWNGEGVQNIVSLGGPLENWFYDGLACIRPDPGAPGFKNCIIKPAFVKELNWLKTHHDSPYGRISVDWARKDGKIDVDVTIPINTTAIIYLPEKNIREGGLPIRKANGISFLRLENDRAVYKLSSGKYAFEITPTKTISINKAPIIKNKKGDRIRTSSFTKSIEIVIESDPGTTVYYTLDGTEPTTESIKYQSPFEISKHSIIKAIAEKEGNFSFFTATAEVFEVVAFKELKLANNPSGKYPGKGEYTLFDGIKGSANFKDGKWLGFEGDDLQFIIDFGKVKNVSRISVNCLTNEESWIFAPKQIDCFAIENGETFSKQGSLSESDIKLQSIGNLNTFVLNTASFESQYLKIIVHNTGICPIGNAGAGNKAWLFVDEIIIE